MGIKDSEADRTERFTDLVVSTLGDIAENGVTAEQVDTALQQATYHYQEIQPMYPLHMLDRVLDAWVYGMDPLTFLRWASTWRRSGSATVTIRGSSSG